MIRIACIIFCTVTCAAQTAHDCFKELKQDPSRNIPVTLVNIQKRLASIDFYLEDHQKVIKRVQEKIHLEDEGLVNINSAHCRMLDNYNIFTMYVRKRKSHKGEHHPKFFITAYEFANATAATVFYEKVLTSISHVMSEHKVAYSCLLSGRYCYYIETPAYMYHYDFMDKIVKAIDGKARRLDHL